MLIIKDFFHRLYLKFCNSKFIKWIFPVFLFCFISNVNAFSINGKYDLTYGQSSQFYNYASASYDNVVSLGTTFGTEYNVYYTTNSVTTGTYGIGINSRFNEILVPNRWYMLIYATSLPSGGCALPSSFQNQFKAMTTFNGSNYAADVRNYSVVRSIVYWDADAFDSCVYSLVFRVTSTSYMFLGPMNSGSTTTNTWVYYGYYLEDLGTTDGVSNSSLNNSITAMNSNITTMNSNISTQSQNIQNKLDSQTNSINGNIDDEFDKLKNQDHTYNQNASDNVPDKNTITNVTNAESDLLNRVNLDASSIDVSLSSNTTNFIWDIVTNLRATNGKITLLFTSILSLAIIKMVLNR